MSNKYLTKAGKPYENPNSVYAMIRADWLQIETDAFVNFSMSMRDELESYGYSQLVIKEAMQKVKPSHWVLAKQHVDGGKKPQNKKEWDEWGYNAWKASCYTGDE